MSGTTETSRDVNVMVHEFWTDYEPDGQGGVKESHWVRWSKRGDAFYHSSNEKVARIRKMIREEGGQEYHSPLWFAIKPAYEAWLEGRAAPVVGTPLDAWAGVTKRQAKEFIASGYHAVEDIAAMIDSDIPKVRLPEVRKIRDAARAFVEHKKGGAQIEAALAERDQTIEEMRQQLADLAASNAELAQALKTTVSA